MCSSDLVLATSYLDEAERAIDVLALDAGRELAAGTPEEIVAAMPGTLRVSDARPEGEAAQRAWRRGGRWRIWDPPGQPGPLITDLRHQNQDEPDMIMTQTRGESDEPFEPGRPVAPDLQDAVTVAILARELAAGGGEREGGGSR